MAKKKKKQKLSFIKTAKTAGRVLYGLVLALLVIVAATVAASALKLPGSFQLLAVQSGSMEPAIKKMSVVAIRPENSYQVGDVVTVSEPANPKVSVTHRIVSVEEKDGKILYVTKGDANEDADTEKRPKENVLGEVLFSVPFLGYPVSFAKTRDGLIILIIIPATLIVYSELMNIKKEAKRLILERRKRKLTLVEKAEVEVGEEEIKAERWYHKLAGRLLKR
jgi:signal peptidase